MQFLDKYGYPVERVEGRYMLNFFRLLIHTRKIKRGRFVCITHDTLDECDTSQRTSEGCDE